ncbi:MAG: hypothetical protein K8S87_03995, partial [Planctomycetes bacterium]|nr:hypothetical protein [Planctomycetota bacterium]
MKTISSVNTKRFVILFVLFFSLFVCCDNSTQNVIKLNGAFEWINTWGGISYDNIVDSTSDVDNNIYIAGIFTGEVDFDPSSQKHTVKTVDNDADAFVAKFSSAGKFKWVRTFNATATGVCSDSDNNVYLTGYFDENVDFNHGRTPDALKIPTGITDGFLVKLNSKGNFIQVDTFGGTTTDSEVQPSDVSVNSMDDIFVCGDFIYQLQFINVLNCDEETDCFLLKYSANLQRLWGISWGSVDDTDNCN